MLDTKRERPDQLVSDEVNVGVVDMVETHPTEPLAWYLRVPQPGLTGARHRRPRRRWLSP